MRQRIGIGVVAALALIALVPATSSAERGGTETRVVIDGFMTDINRGGGGNDGAWTGRVTSPDVECVGGRRVTLFRETDDGKKKIGSTRTVDVRRGNTGFWGIEAPKPKRGTYFAKVKGSNGCTGDTSQNFKYPKDQPLKARGDRAKAKTKVRVGGWEEGVPTGSWFGYVSSEKNRCQKHRVVQFYMRQGKENVELGSDETQKVGNKWRWTVPDQVPESGEYFALAAPIPGCKRGESKIFSVP